MIDRKNLESIQNNVDVATTILGLARYSDDYSRSAGPSMMFTKDTSNHPNYVPYDIRRPRNNANNADADVAPVVHGANANFNLGCTSRRAMLQGGSRRFSCAIPLSHIFGFCRNVRKVIFGTKHTVVLVRQGTDDDAIWRSAGDAGRVILTKFSLWMPVMTPSISEEDRLLSFMSQGGKSTLSWLTTTTDAYQSAINGLFTWQIASQQGVSAPRHIFIALQNAARVNDQTHSIMIFDQLGVSEVSLRINGHQEPSEDILLNFEQNHVARAYHRLMSFMGRDQNIDTGLQISQLDFTTLYPI
jgi:acyl-CoA synthetase (AMP-forming)/AMP-acid ligase II